MTQLIRKENPLNPEPSENGRSEVSMDKDVQDRSKEAIGGQACVAGFKFLVAFDRSVPAGGGLAVHTCVPP